MSCSASSVAAPRLLRRWWFWAATGIVAAVILLIVGFLAAVPLSSDTLRHRMTASLSDVLDSDVTLGDLHVRALPALHAEGYDLAIRRRGQPELPPLIAIKRFTVDATPFGLWHKHVAHVTIARLDISIPPDSGDPPTDGDKRSQSTPPAAAVDDRAAISSVVIDTLDATEAQLIILPSKERTPPKIWTIHRLRVSNVGASSAMPFEATLRNAVPPGEIKTSGSFGPWHTEVPGRTPLDGTFDFAHADLGVFHGISGDLSAKGSFTGTLARIAAAGVTDTPNFTITDSRHPLALHATYQSLIDGTNGDTRLERIDATFLSSHLLASGAVLDAPPGKHGRTVTLDVKMDRARVEDVLTLAVKGSKALMTGNLQLTTKFVLPPGETDVIDRLRLDGRFAIAQARFTSIDVQAKIDELSHRARARDVDAKRDSVVSNFQGRFTLAGGRLILPDLSFDAPGAAVRLAGQFALKPERLDFRGRLLLDAKISQTVGGFKGMLLKVIDPLFKKDGGGSAIPIKIEGPVKDPSIGLDVGRLFNRGKKP
jgi:hypothetical protein